MHFAQVELIASPKELISRMVEFRHMPTSSWQWKA